ncbi:MAG TPA: winged helix DNA-binding protein [Aliidongia sp.]|uniref:winged helix DNA-binding protein n=1 Tax=Aliidongia sp. TaxID=1914230 RepID=UPI002DDCEC1D|nr:winged helix DNA-binding protein [Aliidongia sp.]HEV2675244.1 winged helix DNA-binding protein [Aliidongia sp.]
MSKRDYIVSSAHLADPGSEELSEFEFGLILAHNAFERWIVRCMAAAGYPDLSKIDILVLHSIHHRGRAKRLADLCFVLNIEDSHVVTYALRKLTQVGLVARARPGKEVFYATTPLGDEACARYRDIRQTCLLAVPMPPVGGTGLGETAGLLRALSGLYDQAARAATSL